jgi:hypothetical protein
MESKLGPLGTSATEWPVVPAPCDYDDGEIGGMKIGRKPAPAPLCPPGKPASCLNKAQVQNHVSKLRLLQGKCLLIERRRLESEKTEGGGGVPQHTFCGRAKFNVLKIPKQSPALSLYYKG